MDVDTINDMEAVEIPDDDSDIQTEKRPIMLLLKCLIRNKQNTVMTNHQIVEILKQEFYISTDTCHELEVDIYIRIIKKYLKDWPQWEELERISSKLSIANDNNAVNKVLNNKYRNLKEYLGVRLEVAKPLAKQAVSKETSSERDVVMEVLCTREQLNNLIYRKPRADINNTIFNINIRQPTTITIKKFPFETCINFWATKITISLPHYLLTRELDYKFEHKLINKVRNNKTPSEIIDTRLFYKNKHLKSVTMQKATFLTYFSDIIKLYENQQTLHSVFKTSFAAIKADLRECTELSLGAMYRRYCNKYKYVRYLSVDNNESMDSKFDLRLEEVVLPSYQISLVKMSKQKPNYFKDLVIIECTMCRIKFNDGPALISQLESHFEEHHQLEPNWQCTNCKQVFDIQYLADNRWRHDC